MPQNKKRLKLIRLLLAIPIFISCSSYSNSELNDEKNLEVHSSKEEAHPLTAEEAYTYCPDSIYDVHLRESYKNKHIKKIYKYRSSRTRRRKLKKLKNEASYLSNQQLYKPSRLPVSEFPVTFNENVNFWIKYFTNKGKKTYLTWLSRSSQYKPYIIEILKDEGLPEELYYLAMIESGFNNRAYSRAKATGTWQFMKGTAKNYGLKVGYWVDERRNLEKSTRAASRLLKDLYKRYDDWYLALAAYNAGPGKVNRAIRKAKTRDFWAISKKRYLLRKETKNYVPKMLAAIIIGENQKYFGFDVNTQSNADMVHLPLENPHKISEIAKFLEVSSRQIKNWNPELKKHITPPPSKGEPYKFKLPKDFVSSFAKIKTKLTKLKIDDIHIHRIRSGESLYKIARRYGISLRKLRNFNPKLKPRSIRPGTKVAVPIPSIKAAKG